MFSRGGTRRRLGLALALVATTTLVIAAASASARTAGDAGARSGSTVRTLSVTEELFAGENITVCDTTEGRNDQAEQVLSDSFMPDADWHVVAVNGSVSGTGMVTWTSAEPIEILVVKQGNGGVAYKFDPTQSSGSNQSKTGDGQPSNGISHLVGCARTTTPPAKGTLRVVKVISEYKPDGTTPDDFAFTVDGTQHSFEADGTNDYEVDPGAYDVVETVTGGAAVTYDNGGECNDLAVVAGQTTTCTITNTFTPPTPGEVTVTKTAEGDSGRVVNWTVTKSGSLTTAASKSGNGQITWNVAWTKTVTEGFTVSGTIVVQNGLEGALDGAELIDELGGDETAFSTLTCAIGDDEWEQGDDIPGGATLTCQYALLFENEPEADSNVAVVEWDDGEESEESDPAPFSFPAESEPALDQVVAVDSRFEFSQMVEASGSTTFTEPVTCAGGSFANTALLYAPGQGEGGGLGEQVATSGQQVVQVGAVDCSTTTVPETPTTPSTPTTPASPPPPVVTPPVVTPPVLTPPTVKPPKVKPVQPAICLRLTVSGKKMLTQGTKTTVAFKVTRAGKPTAGVAVLLKGAGIYRVAKTNSRGIVALAVTPGKSGILAATITGGKKGCNAARLGVIGVFEPPVTG